LARMAQGEKADRDCEELQRLAYERLAGWRVWPLCNRSALSSDR
jgi:hypothetical protein